MPEGQHAEKAVLLPFRLGPASVEYDIDGSTYEVRVWTDSQWGLIAESDLPGGAVRLGSVGWIELRRISST